MYNNIIVCRQKGSGRRERSFRSILMPKESNVQGMSSINTGFYAICIYLIVSYNLIFLTKLVITRCMVDTSQDPELLAVNLASFIKRLTDEFCHVTCDTLFKGIY